MNNKQLFTQAHKMTKEIKKEYVNVNYSFQFSLCLSYLKSEGVQEMKENVELKGTDKQIEWAEQLREKILNRFDERLEEILNYEYVFIRNTLIQNKQFFKNKPKTREDARMEYANLLKEVKSVIEQQTEAKFFIETRIYNVGEMVENFYDDKSYGHKFFI